MSSSSVGRSRYPSSLSPTVPWGTHTTGRVPGVTRPTSLSPECSVPSLAAVLGPLTWLNRMGQAGGARCPLAYRWGPRPANRCNRPGSRAVGDPCLADPYHTVVILLPFRAHQPWRISNVRPRVLPGGVKTSGAAFVLLSIAPCVQSKQYLHVHV